MSKESKNEPKSRKHILPVYMAIGTALGTGVGVGLSQIGMGAGVGLALGCVVGVMAYKGEGK